MTGVLSENTSMMKAIELSQYAYGGVEELCLYEYDMEPWNGEPAETIMQMHQLRWNYNVNFG